MQITQSTGYFYAALCASMRLLSLILISCIVCREVIYSTQKEGEITARLKQMEVALDAIEIGKKMLKLRLRWLKRKQKY